MHPDVELDCGNIGILFFITSKSRILQPVDEDVESIKEGNCYFPHTRVSHNLKISNCFKEIMLPVPS